MQELKNDIDELILEEKRQEALEYQLNDLAKNVDQYKLSESEWKKRILKTISNLELIYDDHEFRHSYSGIYDLIFSLRIEEREVLLFNFRPISYAVDGASKDIHFKKCIKKLQDHLYLESSRLADLGDYNQRALDLSKTIEDFEDNKDQFNKDIMAAYKQVSELKAELDGFSTQSITVLSIFTGIVMAFFGGFTILGGAFENISNANNAKLFLMVCLLGFILFNTIFVFIYSAAKISGKSIAVTCRHERCTDCDKKHSKLARLFYKYPYIAFVDGFLVLGIVIFLYNL